MPGRRSREPGPLLRREVGVSGTHWLEPKWFALPGYLFALSMAAVGCWGFSNRWLQEPAIQLHFPDLASGMHLVFGVLAASLCAIAVKLTFLFLVVLVDEHYDVR